MENKLSIGTKVLFHQDGSDKLTTGIVDSDPTNELYPVKIRGQGILWVKGDVLQTDQDGSDDRLEHIAINVRTRMRRVADDICYIGQSLLEAKELLGHGEFLPWIDREFEMSERSAQNFMNVAQAFGESANFADLGSIATSAMYELAAPSKTSPEAVEEAVTRATSGEKIDAPKAREILTRHKPTRARPLAKAAKKKSPPASQGEQEAGNNESNSSIVVASELISEPQQLSLEPVEPQPIMTRVEWEESQFVRAAVAERKDLREQLSNLSQALFDKEQEIQDRDRRLASLEELTKNLREQLSEEQAKISFQRKHIEMLEEQIKIMKQQRNAENRAIAASKKRTAKKVAEVDVK